MPGFAGGDDGAAVTGVVVEPPPPHAATKRSNPTANPGHSLENRMRPPGKMQASSCLERTSIIRPCSKEAIAVLNQRALFESSPRGVQKASRVGRLVADEERELDFLGLCRGGALPQRGSLLEVGFAAEGIGDLLRTLDNALR